MPSKDPNYNPRWAKVIFNEFCLHFMEKSIEECGLDVKQSIKDLMAFNGEGDSFGSYMVRVAEERIEKNRESRGKGGKLGGRPTKTEITEKNPDQLIYGSFENVFLSQEEYNDLAQRFGNINELNSAIENLSAKLEDGSTESKNHYATLAYWAQCREHNQAVQEKAPRKKSWDEQSIENYNNAMALIEAKYGK